MLQPFSSDEEGIVEIASDAPLASFEPVIKSKRGAIAATLVLIYVFLLSVLLPPIDVVAVLR